MNPEAKKRPGHGFRQLPKYVTSCKVEIREPRVVVKNSAPRIPKGHALQVVLFKPSLRGFLVGEDLEVVRVTNLLASVLT